MKNGIVLLMLIGNVALYASDRALEPDLAKLDDGKGLSVVNRNISHVFEDSRSAIHFDERPGGGVAWLDGVTFSNGTIEFDVKGKNVAQKSFVGLAFHGENDSTFDAVYFRPFNFKASEALARSHSVQYVSIPGYGWPKLRKEHPGVYENPLQPQPDPDGWFHVRIVIDSPRIRVFVNDARDPCLEVEQIVTRKTGMLGLWVGDNSDGDFANLKVVSGR